MTDNIDTRTKILDVSEELFYSKGYSETSMAEIQNEVGIARGTLYYHFNTKENILDEVILRQIDKAFSKLDKISKDNTLSISQRLTKSIIYMNVSTKEEYSPENLHRPENALLHEKTNHLIVKKAVPYFSNIVREGIKEGIFNTKYPEEVVEILLIYGNTVFDFNQNYDQGDVQKKAEAFIYMTNILLGAKPGTLDFSEIFRWFITN